MVADVHRVVEFFDHLGDAAACTAGGDKGSFNSSHVFRCRFLAVLESRTQSFQHLVMVERDRAETGAVI